MKKSDDNNKVKLSEKISLKFRRKWLVDSTKVILIIAILVAAYIALNLGIEQVDLPKIDVTENKIYSLSDASKKAIENVQNDTIIYTYGFEDDSSLIDLLKQYNKANNRITYEILTEESNYDMVQKYSLSEGYYELIIKSGDSEKVIDASTEFSTYDYTTYQSIDTTEQVITNSILALNEENKPNIYFVEGHGEFSATELGVLNAYLKNEAFIVNTLNMATTNSIPDDCDILAIMSPTSDFLDTEVTLIKDYINKGGEIYFSMDTVSEETSMPNVQAVLAEYGVSVQNGYIVENTTSSKYPYIFTPELSSTHKITSDLYSDNGKIYLMYSGRLKFLSDDELSNLNVEKEILLNSSSNSAFITDLSTNLTTAQTTAEVGACDIAAVMTKTITQSTDEDSDDTTDLTSKLVIVASGNFITDYNSPLSETYPLSYIGNNKDFVINAMSYLGDKGNILTIRKDMASSTYMPTEVQNRIVLAIIFLIPLVIIIIGIIVWNYRKKRK